MIRIFHADFDLFTTKNARSQSFRANRVWFTKCHSVTEKQYSGHLRRTFTFFYYIDHVNNPGYDFCLDIFP